MSEVHLPHQHSDEGTMRELQESVETIGSFQTVADVFKQLSDSSRVRIFWLLCHCEECVIDLSAMVGMSSPAVSHHLRQLRESGLLVSRRVGKEVYYRAAENEQAQLLHRMIERTMEISCPEEESKAATGAPHLPPLDAEVYEGGGTSEQIETIRAVHDYLTQHLDSRTTIDELSRRFLMNPSTMKALFKSVYGSSLASHIREHRMQHAAKLLLEGDENVAQVARADARRLQFVNDSEQAFQLPGRRFKPHREGDVVGHGLQVAAQVTVLVDAPDQVYGQFHLALGKVAEPQLLDQVLLQRPSLGQEDRALLVVLRVVIDTAFIGRGVVFTQILVDRNLLGLFLVLGSTILFLQHDIVFDLLFDTLFELHGGQFQQLDHLYLLRRELLLKRQYLFLINSHIGSKLRIVQHSEFGLFIYRVSGFSKVV